MTQTQTLEDRALQTARRWLNLPEERETQTAPSESPSPEQASSTSSPAPKAQTTPTSTGRAASLLRGANGKKKAGRAHVNVDVAAEPAAPAEPAPLAQETASEDDTELPSDPGALQALIDAARRVTPGVLRAARAVDDLSTHAEAELTYLRGAPPSFIEPGIGVIVAAATTRTGEDPEYLAVLTQALLNEANEKTEPESAT